MNSIEGYLRALLGRFRQVAPPESPVDARDYRSPVDAYWNVHTVNSVALTSAWQSERYLKWRFAQYPLFREFMQLWGGHEGETILDYGCGPGDDTVGFLLRSGARRVISVDVSQKALDLARARIALHGDAARRSELLLVSDADPKIPLADGTVDYVHCGGVLHHTSDPQTILREFRRVLTPTGRACVMVYNRDSLWYHLYTAYERMVLRGDFAGMSVDAAFALNTDGPVCPVSRCYSAAEWIRVCAGAGFDAQFVGGYLSLRELELMRQHGAAAKTDPRLAEEHRRFIAGLSYDEHGYPLYAGKHAGIGGVYRLAKRAS